MPSMMHLCNELGCVALGKGDYKEARKHFRYMVKEAQKHGEREQAGALNRLGLVCMRDRRYKEAEESYRQCLDLCERMYGPAHPEVASELNNLAFVLWKGYGDKAKARPLFEKSVQLLENAIPFSSEFSEAQLQTYARAFENLGGLHEEEREFDAAENLYRKALNIKVDAGGPSSPEVFKSVHFLSNLLAKQGRAQDSKELFEKFLPSIRHFSGTVNNVELNSLLTLIDRN